MYTGKSVPFSFVDCTTPSDGLVHSAPRVPRQIVPERYKGLWTDLRETRLARWFIGVFRVVRLDKNNHVRTQWKWRPAASTAVGIQESWEKRRRHDLERQFVFAVYYDDYFRTKDFERAPVTAREDRGVTVVVKWGKKKKCKTLTAQRLFLLTCGSQVGHCLVIITIMIMMS